MNALLALFALILTAGILIIMPETGAPALLVGAVAAGIAGLLFSRTGENSRFLLRVFVGALLIRVLIGAIIYAFHLQDFFGGDANTYDYYGFALLKGWQEDKYYLSLVKQFVGPSSAGGWGMLYMVAAIYGAVGRNMLAVQFVNAVLGAATAPIIFLCAQHIFSNLKVARFSALLAAFYPSLVLWSSQGLKDGPIVFLLALSMLATLKLGEKFNLKFLAVLACSLFALLSLRFYIFYMMVAAIAGAFIIGMRPVTAQSLIRQFVVIVAIGVFLTYFGVMRYANVQVEQFGNLQTVQRSRLDLARSAESGFGGDVDVSTTYGALSIIPTGMVYLLFAPFPWQLTSLRQSITLPEMIVWWASVPILVLGLWFTIKYRLRQVSPILIFSAMLTLAYSLFQGNIGTAYRQRSQLLVFYFIFVAVGIVLLQEKREEYRQQREMERQRLAGGRKSMTPPYPTNTRPHTWKDEGDKTKADEEKVEKTEIKGEEESE
jgi:Dolichyl-phosphate-mannose-protein mannosyltransferase